MFCLYLDEPCARSSACSSAVGFLAIAPFSFTVGGGTAGDEVAFSAGLGTELSEVGSADDVITPKRAVSFRHEVDHWR